MKKLVRGGEDGVQSDQKYKNKNKKKEVEAQIEKQKGTEVMSEQKRKEAEVKRMGGGETEGQTGIKNEENEGEFDRGRIMGHSFLVQVQTVYKGGRETHGIIFIIISSSSSSSCPETTPDATPL